MSRTPLVTRTPLLPALWIWVGAWASCSGWLLSAAHRLDATGYVVALLLGVGAGGIAWKIGALENIQTPSFHRLKRRVIRPLPLAFFALAALAFLGGALYSPANYDGLAYRTPRVLHWLAEGRWHWIHTEFQRLNTRACGFEWLTAPLIALTKTDRLSFLINIVSFALLPGLVFGVFTRFGVRRKVAWRWMWIVPGGYCYLLQAGSIANDLPAAVYALAAVDFGLRAKTSGRCVELWISILAVALMTGMKASNLPLLLPWLVAAAPALPLAFRKPLATALVCVIAAFSSFLPTAALNLRHCGDWTGMAAERSGMAHANPLVCATWNSILLPMQNLVPPILPWTNAWNQSARNVFPDALLKKVDETFETGGAHLGVSEMQLEEDAGLGFGVSVLLLATFAAGLGKTAGRAAGTGHAAHRIVLAAVCVALLAFMAKSGLSTVARLVTPYYALLTPALLLSPAQERIVRSAWWRYAVAGMFFAAAALLVVQPPRPLFPTALAIEKMRALHVVPQLLSRTEAVYSVYRQRGEAFAPARDALPADANILGLISFDDPETSLWRPFGSRRIRHVKPGDTNDSIRSRDIRYVLVSSEKLTSLTQESVEDWIATHHAEVLKTIPLRLRVTKIGDPRHSSLLDWVLVKIPDADKP